MEKVAFIICYNNELYMRECMDYISWLKVPEDVETEIIGIVEAGSMTAGYNSAMHDSDAKYKVYLHQDVFILNENFISDIITIFKNYSEYGMLGVIGSDYMIPDANYWMGWNTGKCNANDSLRQISIKLKECEGIREVHAIDGMIMITQYDVEWRKDIFDGFDFYDISQSLEFKKHGYKIGVPYQEYAWCNHVCGHSKLSKYDLYREKFCREYSQYGYRYRIDSENEKRRIQNAKIEKMLPTMRQALDEGNFNRLTNLLFEGLNYFVYNTELCQLKIINEVILEEIKENIECGFYDNSLSTDEMLGKYMLYQFLINRLEYEKPLEHMEDVLNAIIGGGLLAAEKIAEYTVLDVDKVVRTLKNYSALKGKNILEENIPEMKNSPQIIDKSKIAYCIPTYNHPDVIEDVLEKVGFLYKKFDIDVYIYDSSEDNRTYWVIKHLVDRGMDHLYYVKIDTQIGLDEKLIKIFQGYGLKKKYKYLWMVKDRVYVPENTLQLLAYETEREYDVIFLDAAISEEKISMMKQVYCDPAEFYNVAGCLATSMNTTIFHCDRLLKNIDWDDFRKRYFFEGENQYDHFTVLFHTIGVKKDVKVRLLCGDQVQFCESDLGKSLWIKRTFQIWGNLWPRVNEALPACYKKYKKKVIKEAASLPWILGSIDILLILKEKGCLSPEIYEIFKDNWKNISNVSLTDFKYIAYASNRELRGKGTNFWTVLDYLLINERYQEIYTVYYNYCWLKQLSEDGKYTILGECLRIYAEEKQRNLDKTILSCETHMDEVIEKYMVIKYMLMRLEYDIDVEQWGNISGYVTQKHISSPFIMYIANKHCKNPQKALESLVNILNK